MHNTDSHWCYIIGIMPFDGEGAEASACMILTHIGPILSVVCLLMAKALMLLHA